MRSSSLLFTTTTRFFFFFFSTACLDVCHNNKPGVVLGFSVTTPPRPHQHHDEPAITQVQEENLGVAVVDRRRALQSGILASATIAAGGTTTLFPPTASARTPGSSDVKEAVCQIRDAAADLRKLQADWSLYSVIDAEGRAGSTDGARRILGGIAPQAGTAAIAAAQQTPLYRIDVAFVTIRRAAIDAADDDGGGSNDDSWAGALDLDAFEELADKIQYYVQKADGNFYSIVFASKGTRMIQDILTETKSLVTAGIADLDAMIVLLQEAGAPGL